MLAEFAFQRTWITNPELDLNFFLLWHLPEYRSLLGRLAESPRSSEVRRPTPALRKRRQLHQILPRHRFNRLPGLAPRRQTTHDNERIESFFPQQMRHPGAGRFARPSPVEIN